MYMYVLEECARICAVHERGTVKMKVIPFWCKEKERGGVRRKYGRQRDKERRKRGSERGRGGDRQRERKVGERKEKRVLTS